MNQTTLLALTKEESNLLAFLVVVNDLFIAYCLPVGVILTTVNNVVVFLILIKKGPLRNKLCKTVRIYYMAMTFGDINTAIAAHLTYFLGKTCITNSNVTSEFLRNLK